MQISDAVRRIEKYLNSSLNLPFFVSVENGRDYVDLCKRFSGLHTVRISDYCEEDSYPDYDKLFDTLRHTPSSTLLLGMGEAVQFVGDRLPIQNIMSSTFSCKVVIPCRGISALFDEFCANEPRFSNLRFCSVDGAYNCTIIHVSTSFKFEGAIRGYKALLQTLETGVHEDRIYVQTNLLIKTTYNIDSAYSAIKERISPFNVSHNALSDKEWQEFLSDDKVDGYPLEHWRSYLSYLLNPPVNAYLKAVTTHSANYSEYQYNLLNYLLEISPYASEFWELYYSRKELFQFINKKYYDANIANYIMQSQEKRSDRIYYLTDSTKIERYEIITAIVEAQIIPNELEKIYPDLSYYLNDYIFSSDLPAELTSYFIQYKRQKLFNRLDDAFLNLVNEIASDGKRIFNLLRAKNSIIEKFDNEQTTLVWIDALGVEYLGYLQKVAHEMELSITFHIGRSVLPTLTKYNSDFYYQSWKGAKEDKISDFDSRKHKDSNYRNLGRTDAPVYLADELMDLRSYLERIRNLLQQGKQRVIIASDHGASRPVVLHTTKKKWEIQEDDQQTALQKESRHGGRCCYATKSNVKPSCASVEKTEDGKEFWVLANYDRFRIGKESGVEMHGGGTLEEVVVPIIEIALSNTANRPKIKCETPEAYFTDTQGPAIILFCPTPIKNLRMKIEGKMYTSERTEDNRYKIVLAGCEKRQREIHAECFNGDDFLTSFEVKISRKNKGMKEDTFADEFFKW